MEPRPRCDTGSILCDSHAHATVLSSRGMSIVNNLLNLRLIVGAAQSASFPISGDESRPMVNTIFHIRIVSLIPRQQGKV